MTTPAEDAPTTTRFAPGSQIRQPKQFGRRAVRSLRASLPLARRLFIRDLRARYRLSVLGYAWIMLPAVAQTGVWLFLNESNIINSGKTDIPLPLYVLLGTLLYQAFTDALTAPGAQLQAAGSMLARVSFPVESLPLAGFADALLNSVVRLTVVAPVLVAYRVRPSATVLLAPVGLLSLLLLGFAIGLLIAPFGVLYQDVGRVVTIVMGFWLLVTPVAYTIPTSGPGRYVATLNPVSPALEATRRWLTGGSLDPVGPLLIVLAISLVLVTAGWTLFRLAVPHLVDRVGT